jgi:ATP-dependent 26S proteasome regulatory subunit
MDDSTLASLESALSATPDNEHLLSVVLGACLERGEAARAAGHLRGVEPGDLEENEGRLAAGEVLLSAGEAERALAFVAGRDDAAHQLLAARALLALDRLEEGRTAYRAAVDANPTCEDPDLEKRLGSTVRTYHRPSSSDDGVVRLKVISNDDTDASEADRLLMPAEETVTFADVGGLAEIKDSIRKKIILPFQKPSLIRRFRKRIGGGILLYGPPGCGKTLLARATAGECEAEFFSVSISDVLDMYIGESERKLHALFEKARTEAPSVLFFDEVEALGGKRQYSRNENASKLVSQFLSEMDGFVQNNQGVLILGATNVPWAVDPAFRRPGRFDRVLFVPPPDRAARETILEILLRDRPVETGIDCRRLAMLTPGFSGADLGNIVETAIDEAIDESLATGTEKPISSTHLQAAVKQIRPTTMEWLTTARNYARYANESGQYNDVLDFLRRHGKS